MKTTIKYQINKKFILENKETNYYRNNQSVRNLKEQFVSYVELENRLKALEENFSTNISENKTSVYHIDGFENWKDIYY